MLISLIFGIILGAAGIIFALQNNATVALTFLGWQFSTSLAVLIILALLIGALIALLVSMPGAIRESFRMGSLRRENQRLSNDLADARRKLLETVERPVVVQSPSSPVIDVRPA